MLYMLYTHYKTNDISDITNYKSDGFSWTKPLYKVVPFLDQPLYLVGGWPTPLKNMSSSVGNHDIPNIWKHKIHVPNHQSEVIYTE